MIAKKVLVAAVVAVGMLGSAVSFAEQTEVFSVVIKDHRFHPDRIEAPAGKPFILEVKNEDDTPEEFESKTLHREKVIAPGKTAKIKFDATAPGEYEFVGEFHEDETKGVIVVK